MKSSVQHHSPDSQVGVFECEVTLKFRMIEDRQVVQDPEQLIELLVEAFAYGSDEFVEALQSHFAIDEIPETKASPKMRRQLIRLRNAKWMA